MTKDYLTPLEAAEYACVPLADFEALADSCGVLSFQYMCQRVYHKADLQASMERAWRLSIGGAVALPTFPGFKASRGASASLGVFTVTEAEADGVEIGRGNEEGFGELHAHGLRAADRAYQHPRPRHEHHLNELERIRRENEMAESFRSELGGRCYGARRASALRVC